jgi:hypothetical protein
MKITSEQLKVVNNKPLHENTYWPSHNQFVTERTNRGGINISDTNSGGATIASSATIAITNSNSSSTDPANAIGG